MDVQETPSKYFKVFLIVTGKGETQFANRFFRPLTSCGNVTFKFYRRIGQLSPRTSKKHLPGIPLKDQELGLDVLAKLMECETNLVMILDDLEYSRLRIAGQVFNRYRTAIDSLCPNNDMRQRASVHFFVMMIEAYYFADAPAINCVLGTNLTDHKGDVEAIRHPKNDLKNLSSSFDEMRHGKEIAEQVDFEKVLSDPNTCKALRTAYAWVADRIGCNFNDRFRLQSGSLYGITKDQL